MKSLLRLFTLSVAGDTTPIARCSRLPPPRRGLMADRPLAAPLVGIKVLEFSHTVMGPTAL